MSRRTVAILGAGPAGVAAALALARRGFDVKVFERESRVGGNAGSFELAGIRVDYGSHRLHPASDPQVLAEIRDLLGDDLLERPRHGRIRLMGRWIHFPLRPADLALRAHPVFALGVGADMLRKALPSRASDSGDENFASVLEEGLGRTICREFYFPYARKMWGIEPNEIAAAQAYKRVSAGSLAKMIKRLLPGGTGSGAANTKGIFYYPRNGYGQISERLCEAAELAGARVHLGKAVDCARRRADGFAIEVSGEEPLHADFLLSTIPPGPLLRLLDPAPPGDVQRAAAALELRSMLLIYLVLETDRFTEFDAHYFPGADLQITRLSEVRNYTDRAEPQGRTVLCAELPCSKEDEVWSMSDAALGELVLENLARAAIPVRVPLLEVAVKRLPAAYPIYRTGYETHFETMDAYLSKVEGLLFFGRQGLFAHDNTHHAIYMANAAAECLREDGSIDSERWAEYRAIFETHVVED